MYSENSESETRRAEWRNARKSYRETCREAKKEWQEERWKEVEDCNNASQFWTAIGKFRKNRKVVNNSIKDGEWIKHFCTLLGAEPMQREEVAMRKSEKDETK